MKVINMPLTEKEKGDLALYHVLDDNDNFITEVNMYEDGILDCDHCYNKQQDLMDAGVEVESDMLRMECEHVDAVIEWQKLNICIIVTLIQNNTITLMDRHYNPAEAEEVFRDLCEIHKPKWKNLSQSDKNCIIADRTTKIPNGSISMNKLDWETWRLE